MATANELLTLARKQLNITELPPNSNNVKYNTWYYGREVSGSDYPWCMAFVQWVFWQMGVKLPIRTASCGALMRAAQAAGCWVTSNFQPGDVVIYDFSGKKLTTEHCGIVEMALPNYGVQAIEGNTSVSGSQSNGGMVCRKNRASKYIIGAVRPKFDAEMKEEDDMDIKTMISQMTDEQAYELLVKAQRHAATLPAPDWAKAELQEAVGVGITDGTRPMELIPRYQAAIMAKRAAV